MSEIIFVEKIAYVSSGIRCEIDISRFREQFEQAQWYLGNQVLRDCRDFMPMRTASLRNHSMVLREGREVLFPGPYARFQYMGKVMVDPDTGSPWARKDVQKVVTNRDLTYGTGGAKWFDAAKAARGDTWISEVKRIGGGGS